MILIIDFGSQTTKLIGRRLGDMGADVSYSEPEDAFPAIAKERPDGIILSGGPSFVNLNGSPNVEKKIFSFGVPILGVCYGMQLTGLLLGGTVKPGKTKEYGPATFRLMRPSRLFGSISTNPFRVWMSHGDQVFEVPPGFVVTGGTDGLPVAAMENEKKQIYCLQFHPEIEHTQYGNLILKNFVEHICRVKLKKRALAVPSVIKETANAIGGKTALIAVSGGVDSTVAAALAARAIGHRLIPVYISSGLMRPGTGDAVERFFTAHFRIRPVIIHAETQFLQALRGLTDPEEKRKAIGALYIRLFEAEARRHPDVRVLIQGTIFSDVIESRGSKNADKIKSHHNVGGLPPTMNLRLVEPLRNLYKDEVRSLGKKLGLPDSVIQKQVFPGPGFAIRIIGEVTEGRLIQEKQADQIVMEEMEKSGWRRKVYMSFPVMTGARSTAVKGDGRFFGEVAAIRIIESHDVMTTTWSRLPYSLLQAMSSRIINEVPGISRVVYDITTKPPATMEWE